VAQWKLFPLLQLLLSGKKLAADEWLSLALQRYLCSSARCLCTPLGFHKRPRSKKCQPVLKIHNEQEYERERIKRACQSEMTRKPAPLGSKQVAKSDS
jgi:hypothetical protein